MKSNYLLPRLFALAALVAMLSSSTAFKSNESSIRLKFVDSATTEFAMGFMPATTAKEITRSTFKSKVKNWLTHKPYQADNPRQWVAYYYNSSIKLENSTGVPFQIFLAKPWLETNAGYTGVGPKGNWHGLKSSKKSAKKLKGFDAEDNEKVSYAGFESRWEMMVEMANVIKRPLYQSKIKAWAEAEPDMPSWYHYCMGMQIHPDINQNTPGWAANGGSTGNYPGLSGNEISRIPKVYKARKKHAKKMVNWVVKNIYAGQKADAFNKDLE